MKYQVEVALPVEDYLKVPFEQSSRDDRSSAFIQCSEDQAKAREVFEALAASHEVLALLLNVKFIEFDSSNASHAHAYFSVDYEADKDLDKLMEESQDPLERMGIIAEGP